MAIHGINHVTLQVRNLDIAEGFYVGVLGLKRVGSRSTMRFYSSGLHAHELALMENPAIECSKETGFVHLCFNVESEAALHELHRRCVTNGISTSGGVNHIIMHSFYTRDPDGYSIELGIDRPRQEWEHDSRAFIVDKPLLW